MAKDPEEEKTLEEILQDLDDQGALIGVWDKGSGDMRSFEEMLQRGIDMVQKKIEEEENQDD